MQVFLPYPSFRESVACLDKSRLGNQTWRECKTILNGGWKHHPVSKMWADYKPALALYGLQGLTELLDRHDIDTAKYLVLWTYFEQFIPTEDKWLVILWLPAILQHKYQPPFIGNPDFHLSHRLNLLYKDPDHYSKYFTEPVPTTKPDYYWPTMEPTQ